jgi:archaeosortase C (PEF-CTERM variant)
MNEKYKKIVKILIILSLFTGATIEINEGSKIIGFFLFVIGAIIVSRMEVKQTYAIKGKRLYIFLGLIVVLSDIIFNIKSINGIGTLDSMAFFLGISLIAMGTNKESSKQLGEFGFYISLVFIVMFVIFYTLLGYFNINFLHLFDHYFILMPTVALIKIIGIPVEIIATETVIIHGAVPMTIVIGGPCSGLYSMFLLIGIVTGYSRIERMGIRQSLRLFGLAVLIAYIANLVRVVILYVTAYLYGMEVMMMVHTHIGWIIFALTAGGIMFIMNRK